MVVGADNKVELRTVTTTQAIGDKWVVTDGLKAGDKVIVTGLQKIRPGVQVNAQEVDQNAADKKQAASDTAPKS
jgi:membrane fusion protein (multidrug efflux system)